MRIIAAVVFLFVLLIYVPQSARAACAKKHAMLREAAARIQDVVSSTDSDQQLRDADRIRELNSSISDEDCVGISLEDQQLKDIVSSAAFTVMASQDFSEPFKSNNIGMQPIEIIVAKSLDTTETADCRCYARRQAATRIWASGITLRVMWPKRASALVASSSQALWSILSQQLNSMIDTTLGSIDQPFAQYERIFGLIDRELLKYCGQIATGQLKPKSCEYNIYGVPTPSPTPSDTSTRILDSMRFVRKAFDTDLLPWTRPPKKTGVAL